MIQRMTPKFSWRVDRVDVMLVCGLAVVAFSYALGYRLDWAQAENKGAQATVVSVTASAAVQAPPAVPESPAAVAVAVPAPAPEAAILPEPDAEAWEMMTRELSSIASRYPGRVAIALRDLKKGRSWTYHQDDLFPSASLIKVPIMACVFMRIKEGRLSLYDKLTLRRRHRVGGSGSLKWRPDGTRLSVRELLQFMISESDNTATQMLLEAVGFGYAQQQFPRLGLVYTGIFEEGMTIKGGRVSHENYTTAREMNMLMERIYMGELVDKPSSELMLQILRHRKAVASRLAKSLPRGWEIAHKTGLLRQACHDSAVIFSPNGDYAVTVLTGGNGSYKYAKDFISRLGRVTYRHFGGSARYTYYARASGRRHVAVR